MKLPAALALTALAALALPGAAMAASATVTGDSGEALALSESGPVQIRNMSPTVVPAFDPADKRYGIQIVGPDTSTTASLGTGCSAIEGTDVSEAVQYQGNGTYTVRVATTTDENDISCDKATTQTFSFVISASTSLTAPGATLLLRKPGTSDYIDHAFSLAVNPGAAGYGIYYATDATVGANGAVSGEGYAEVDVPASGATTIEFPGTGHYTLVGNALAGVAGSPFSPPVKVKVVAPFDFADVPYFRDSRGPIYRISGKLGDPSAAGQRIIVSMAKRKGKFRRLAKPKIGSVGEFGFRFKLRGRGRYRIKYVFKGSDLMVAGSYTQKATFKRVGG